MLSRLLTILLGLVIITIITPLSHFLTLKSVNADIETATPVGWAVGLVFSFVLGLAAIRLITRSRVVSKPNLVILWTMLTIAAPVMNIGLVRAAFMEMYVPLGEYMVNGTSTYRTMYDSRSRMWYPITPSREALSWHKAQRLIRQLENTGTLSKRSRAAEQLVSTVNYWAATFRRVGDNPLTQTQAETLQRDAQRTPQWIEQLGVDEAERVLGDLASPELDLAIERLGVSLDQITSQRDAAAERSHQALGRLQAVLPYFDEHEASQTVDKIARFEQAGDVFTIRRIERDYERLTEQEQLDLGARRALLEAPLGDLIDAADDPKSIWSNPVYDELEIEHLDLDQLREADLPWLGDLLEALSTYYGPVEGRDPQPLREALSADVSALASQDRQALRSHLTTRIAQSLDALPEPRVRQTMGSMIYRMSREERNAVMSAGDEADHPSENIIGFQKSLWTGLEAQRQRQQMTVGERITQVREELPWRLWVTPMIMWGTLFVVIFIGMMALAEWLRRKWIDRENLAFPLVDVADYMIRHDSLLETADDVRSPKPRPMMFNTFFLIGVALGFAWVFAEALSWYKFVPTQLTTAFNISNDVFKTGAFKQMDKVGFVLSPIVLGIAFLVSLEISFSVWVMFILYTLVTWMIKLRVDAPLLQDSMYTGWAGGRFYPFPMEQFLGASVCMAAIVLYKSIRSKTKAVADPQVGAYIHPKLNIVLLVGVPVVFLAMMYQFGITNITFMVIMAAFVMAQTIAAARARAETGLHTHHVTYEFTKLPMVFGMTGWTGAKVYSLFCAIVFLPMTLLFRTLPQQLENLELARRHRVRFSTIAAATLLAFIAAVAVGMLSNLVFSYYWGPDFWGPNQKMADQGAASTYGIAAYPTWLSHFLGEPGMGNFTSWHWIRVYCILIGAGVFALLTFLRGQFLRFPIHPLGYFLVLASIFYPWASPYVKEMTSHAPAESSILWGSVLVAWILKKLTVKYGGMNSYKHAKPAFIGLVVGAVFCVFAFNMVDLVCSIIAQNVNEPGEFIKHFTDKAPYSPRLY